MWRGLATSIDAANYWRTLDHLHCPMTLYYSKITHTHKCDSKKRLNMKQTSSTLNRNNHSKFQLPFFSVLPFTTTAITKQQFAKIAKYGHYRLQNGTEKKAAYKRQKLSHSFGAYLCRVSGKWSLNSWSRMHNAGVSVSPGLKSTYDGLATTPVCMTPTYRQSGSQVRVQASPTWGQS